MSSIQKKGMKRSVMKKRLAKESGIATKDHVDAKKEDVLIQALKLDAQLREIESAVVAAYIEDLESGAAFPPIVVFRDEGNNFWLADGSINGELLRKIIHEVLKRVVDEASPECFVRLILSGI
jgi:hypothetical protein